MRKLARKRESLAHKQAESAKAAQMRKQHDTTTPKNNLQTPQEVSRLKWEREEKQKQRAIQMAHEMQQKVSEVSGFLFDDYNWLTHNSGKWQHANNSRCSKPPKTACPMV